MEANQREILRAEKKEQRRRKKFKAAWIVIALLASALIVMRLCEIDFNSMSGNNSVEVIADEHGFPYSLPSGNENSFGAVGNDIYSLSDTAYTVINSSSAETQLDIRHGYANPVISSAGGYTVLYDQGASSFRLDTAKENIYESSCENKILCADVSASGAVAMGKTSSESKSHISVYSKSLSEKMAYDVDFGYVTVVAIDARGSCIAFSAVNSENGRLKTIVYTMNIGDQEPVAQFEYYSSSVFDLKFSSSNLYVVGSDFVSIIKSMKKEVPVYKQGSVHIASFDYNSSDNLVAAYSAYSGAGADRISLIKPSGKVQEIADLSFEVKDISASGSVISVLGGNAIVCYKNNGREKARYSADDTYTSVLQLSSKTFGKHSAVIDLLSE